MGSGIHCVPINNDEVNQWLTQRYANLPFHQACSTISITPQVIVHGIERATEIVDNDEVNQWLTQRYANLPFHQACSTISITPQVIVHGIEH